MNTGDGTDIIYLTYTSLTLDFGHVFVSQCKSRYTLYFPYNEPSDNSKYDRYLFDFLDKTRRR